MKESKILQISNDVAEDMNYGNHTRKQYRETILYWMNHSSALSGEIANLKTEGLLRYARRMVKEHAATTK